MKKYQNQIEIKLRAVIINKGKILLCHNPKKPPLFYYLLGGHMEKGESFGKCLNRELKEEIGIKASKIKLLDIFENFFKDWEGNHHEINFLYEIDASTNPESIISHEKHIELEWVSVNKLEKINLLPINIKKYLVNYLVKK
jgi:ADP-ribose pyrophosphatase YjhB (NUDIX family)